MVKVNVTDNPVKVSVKPINTVCKVMFAEKGKDGKDGKDGVDGKDGYTPQKGIDYFDGKDGDKGAPFTYEDFTPEQLAALIKVESIINALGFTPAPSGFGLGETNSKVVQHCDEAVLPGFYSLDGNENTGYPSEYANFRYGSLIVNRRYATVFQTITQGKITAHRYGTTADGGATWTFNPWEYENPPMVAGVEYRTTERYKDKPVYKKLVNFGALPNTAATSVSIGKGLTMVPPTEGMTYNGNYALSLSIHNGINSVYYNKSDGKLYVDTKNDASKWSAEIIVKYTK